MAKVPFVNEGYTTPKPADTGFVSAPRAQGAGSVFGEALSRTGEMVGQIGDQIQAQDDQTASNAAFNQLQDHVRNVQYGDPNTSDQPGFMQLQGKAAVDAWQSTAQGVNEYRQSLMDGMSPRAQRAFDQQSQSFMESALTAMGSHAGQQREVYQKGTLNASLDNAANLAVSNANNPAAYTSAMQSGISKIRSYYGLQGLGADDPVVTSAVRNWTDGAFKDTIVAKADSGDATGAMNFLASNKGNISPLVASQAEESIRPKYEQERATTAYQSVASPIQAIPPNTDPGAVWNTMLHSETGNRITDNHGNPIVSSKGAVGPAQLLPDTAKETARAVGLPWDENRFRTDGAYNRALGQAYFGKLVQKYGGNLTLACAAYNAGPGRVDEWCKQFGDPRQGAVTDNQWLAQVPYDETRAYVGKAGAAQSAPDNAPSFQRPDFTGQEAALAGNPTLNEREKSMAISYVRRDQTMWEAQTAVQRSNLDDRVHDLTNAYRVGNTTNTIPYGQIKALQEPDEAQRTIQKLEILRQGSIEADALRYASPQQVAETLKRDTDAQRDGEDISNYEARTMVAQQRSAVVQQMQKQMSDDPVSYVATAPAIKDAAMQLQQAEQSGDPAVVQKAQQNYTQQSMALQKFIAPNQPPRMMTNAQVEAVGSQLAAIDPAKEDVLPHIVGLEKQYGDNWHQAFEELVTRGKMSPDYMMLANMGTPAQAVGRQVFANSLKLKTDALEKTVPQPTVTAIRGTASDNPIDDGLAGFKATLDQQGGGAQLYGQIRQAVYRQALNYAGMGQSSDDAVRNAVSDMVGQYDTAGTIRAPKGELAAVQSATAWKLSHLVGNDIQAPASALNLPESDRADYGVSRAKSMGQWVMNSNETGYNLVVPTNSAGQKWIVRGKDGTPLTVSLRDIRSGALIPTTGPDANSYKAENVRYYADQARKAHAAQPDALSEAD